MTVMDLLKPILKNPEEHPTSSDMGQVETINMGHDDEILKNWLAENNPTTFEDQTLEVTITLITDEESVTHQFFIP